MAQLHSRYLIHTACLLTINFFRPTLVTISVAITLQTLSGYSTAYNPLIAQAVANFINSIGIGNPVLTTKIYVPANLPGTVAGPTFDILTLTVSKNGGTPTTGNLTTAFNELPVCDPNAKRDYHREQSMTKDDYLNLITIQHRDKPNFVSVVANSVSMPVYLQGLFTDLLAAFDIDKAIGFQLDILGQWAGIPRTLRVPVSNIFFTWGDTDATGWGYGIWKSDYNSTSLISLPDDVYRNLIRARIAANSWDGTTEGAYAIWSAVFADQAILIQDNGDMSIAIILVGGRVDSLTLALLTNGYIPLKPEGVKVNYYAVPADSNKVFGWGIQSDYIGGWGEASWVKIVTT